MRDFDRAVSNAQSELNILKEVFGDPPDFEKLSESMEQDLVPFVADKEMLQQAIFHKSHLWEYAYILRAKNSPEKWQAFKELHRFFWEAKRAYPKEFADTWRDNFYSLHKAIDDFADLFHLERQKSLEPDVLSVKVAFQEIGAAIENCFKPLARHFLRLHDLAEKTRVKDPSIVKNFTLGEIVAELSRNKYLKEFYQPKPWGISISQWRNISYHNSFSFDEKRNEILCKYGNPKAPKEVALPYEGLLRLCQAFNDIFSLHKTAYTVFSLGITDIISEQIKNIHIKPDTIVGTIIEGLSIDSFEVVHFDWSKNPWELIAIDKQNRGKALLSTSLEVVAKAMSLSAGKELKFSIKEKDTGRIHSGVIKSAQPFNEPDEETQVIGRIR